MQRMVLRWSKKGLGEGRGEEGGNKNKKIKQKVAKGKFILFSGWTGATLFDSSPHASRRIRCVVVGPVVNNPHKKILGFVLPEKKKAQTRVL